MTPDQQYEMLVESLQLLAAPAEEQIAALPDYVCVTDEVLSNFGDAYLLVPQLERVGLISSSAAAALKRVDDLLAEIPNDESLAAADSLRFHDFWSAARAAATAALGALGEPQTAPILKYVAYVR